MCAQKALAIKGIVGSLLCGRGCAGLSLTRVDCGNQSWDQVYIGSEERRLQWARSKLPDLGAGGPNSCITVLGVPALRERAGERFQFPSSAGLENTTGHQMTWLILRLVRVSAVHKISPYMFVDVKNSHFPMLF